MSNGSKTESDQDESDSEQVREESIEIPLEPEVARKMREKRECNSDSNSPQKLKVTKEQLLNDSDEEEEKPANNKLFTQHLPLLGRTPMRKYNAFTV